MHVAIVGAGALGRAFGVRLANGGASVDFVVRGARAAESGPLRIEEVGGSGALEIARPSRVTAIPAHADAILVCVQGDQLDDALVAMLRAGPEVPIVALTPMLPRTHARLRAALGAQLATAMSSITGYVNDAGVTRHWLSKSTPTLIDEPRRREPALDALVKALGAGGIDARLEPGVHETNGATTILFLPLTLGLDIAGSIDALLGDGELSTLSFRAADEGRALAERCGKVAFWAGLVTRFLGPRTIRMGVSMGRSRSPEAIAFVEGHFGRKTHAQNLVMADEACALAEEKGTPHEALDALRARLRRSAAW